MLQLIVFVYGIVVLFRGVFTLGGGRQVVGTRARILGLLCVCVLPVAFVIGLIIGTMAAMDLIEMPTQPVMLALDVVLLLVSMILIYILGNHFFRKQQQEELAEPTQVAPQTSEIYSVTDPDNPYASPSVK